MADSQEYWNRRARQDKIKVIKTAEMGVDNLKKLLKKNLDSVENQIKEFYKKYGDEGKYAESLSYAEFQKYKARLRLKAKTQCYCWVIWEKGYKGETVLRWI